MKTAEPISRQFGLWTRVGPMRNHVGLLDGVQITHGKGLLFWGKGRLIVKYRGLCLEVCKNG